MSGVVVDNDHRFHMESKRLQMDLIAAAEEQARAYHQCSKKELTPSKALGVARRICTVTLDKFEKGLQDIAKQITTEYPEEDYSDLVLLLIDSRTNLFCVDLQNRLEALILEGKQPTDESSEAKLY